MWGVGVLASAAVFCRPSHSGTFLIHLSTCELSPHQVGTQFEGGATPFSSDSPTESISVSVMTRPALHSTPSWRCRRAVTNASLRSVLRLLAVTMRHLLWDTKPREVDIRKTFSKHDKRRGVPDINMYLKGTSTSAGKRLQLAACPQPARVVQETQLRETVCD